MKKGYVALSMLLLVPGFSLNASDARSERRDQTESLSKVAQRKAVVKELNVLLANQSVLLFQSLNYHWNLVGREFHDYHILFGKVYDALFKNIDLVAERIRAINGEALGSMEGMLKEATLKEDTGKTPEPTLMVARLLEQHDLIIDSINTSIEMLETKTKDFGTRKMLEDLVEQYEKTAWMLRSLTEK